MISVLSAVLHHALQSKSKLFYIPSHNPDSAQSPFAMHRTDLHACRYSGSMA